jgi:hypothetical protein
MIFATVVFIALALRYLVLGQIFLDTAKAVKQFQDDEKAGKRIDKPEYYSQGVKLLTYVVAVLIARFWYLFAAYDIDPLKWPTLTIFAIAVFGMLFIRTSGEIHKWTTIGVITTIISLAYYGYIGALLLKL